MEVITGDDCFRKLDLKQHILFYFGAGWCKPCQEAGPKVQELSTQYDSNKIKFFKVDMDDEENKEFIQKCEVQNIPTFILFKNRSFIDRIIGGDIEKIKALINEKVNGIQPTVNKNINNMVNKDIHNVKPVQQPKPAAQPEIKDFYPNDTFQGEYEGFVFKKGDKGLGYYLEKPSGSGSGGSKEIEIHMVYGSWCGHSRNALPAFDELVLMKDIKTSSGSSVTFVKTEDKSPEMAQFKEKVRGFPTYMTVVKEGGNVVSMEQLNGHDRSKDSIINAVKALTV